MLSRDLSPVVEIWIILSGIFRTLDKKKYKENRMKKKDNYHTVAILNNILQKKKNMKSVLF